MVWPVPLEQLAVQVTMTGLVGPEGPKLASPEYEATMEFAPRANCPTGTDTKMGVQKVVVAVHPPPPLSSSVNKTAPLVVSVTMTVPPMGYEELAMLAVT